MARKIPRDIIDNLTYALNTLSEATQRTIIELVRNLTYTSLEDLRQQLIELLDPLFGAATDDAAAFAARMYDEIREFEIGRAFGALTNSKRNPIATERAIRAFLSYLDKDGIERVIELLRERADYEIKKAAGDCLMDNALRDPAKPKFARVPTGAETCNFCIMLASRGFVYDSAESAGALDHWHPHCDCRIVPSWKAHTVSGYNPDRLYRQWKESGFNSAESGHKH